MPRRSVPLALAIACLCAAPAAAQDRARVLVLGDSLAVGMRPYLGTMLAASDLTWQAQSGRTTPWGLTRLRLALKTTTPQVVLVSLGTNDGWSPVRFASRVRRVLAAVPPNACVVWSSIYRPARKGPYAALNRVLRSAARRDRRLQVIDWNAAIGAHRVTLPDGLHPDDAGFEYRSRMYANAVARDCVPATPEPAQPKPGQTPEPSPTGGTPAPTR